MRLVHVTTIPESLGFLKGQISYMKARGFEISAIASPGKYLERFGGDEAIDTYSVSMARRITPFRDLAALSELTQIFKALRPDIVHSHTPKGGLLGMMAAALARVPIRVYHMRGLPMMTAIGAKRRLLTKTEEVACACAHRVLCVSPSVREVAVRARLCPSWKIATPAGGSGNGVDTDRFDPKKWGEKVRRETRERFEIPQEALVIGFVGRLCREKGLLELLEAWSRLTKRFPSVHLLLAGQHDERDGVPESALLKIQQTSAIHWKGHDWNSPALYAAMDVVALPTYREGFPNVALEAAAMCLPIVATDIPGCVDAVRDRETGWLVPPRDVGALEDALARYLDDPELRRAHGTSGRARVMEAFRQEVVWEAIYREYCALALRRTQKHPRPGHGANARDAHGETRI